MADFTDGFVSKAEASYRVGQAYAKGFQDGQAAAREEIEFANRWREEGCGGGCSCHVSSRDFDRPGGVGSDVG